MYIYVFIYIEREKERERVTLYNRLLSGNLAKHISVSILYNLSTLRTQSGEGNCLYKRCSTATTNMLFKNIFTCLFHYVCLLFDYFVLFPI